MSKTLGQVAQKRWREARDAGLLQDDAWQAAAEAVVKASTLTVDNPRGLCSAEEAAVIEAAKAFVEANKSLDGDEWATYDALEKAVEALQEVEGE